MIVQEPEYIPLAMINALAYCARRFVYEFVQAEMLVNEHVLEGSLLHMGVDLGGRAWTDQAVQERRVYVWSEQLRLAGVCDVVEERADQLYPVEYKKGKPGKWHNDHAQLCAQALCLEERMGCSMTQGEIFYFSVRRRETVEFTAALRAEVARLAQEAHRLATSANRGELPPVLDMKAKCRDCSLQPLCLPDEMRRLRQQRQVAVWEELD